MMFTIANGIVLKGRDLNPVKENIVIDGGIIVEIAKDAKEGKVIDVDKAIVSPSFINGHTHIGDSIIKDQGYGLSLSEMVKPPDGVKHIALSQASDDELISSMRDTMFEMLQSGTTHFIDYREGGVKGVKLLREASKDLPINPIILGRDDSFYDSEPDLHEVKIAIRKLLKEADGIAPSGFGEITCEVANLIVEECAKKNKLSSIHVAESKSNQLESIEEFRQTEIERGISCDFNQLVHCTNPRNNDLYLLNYYKPQVVVCPRANATLNVGIPPLNQFLEFNIPTLLGSDNVMLNSPNMLKELEFSLKIMSVAYGNYINPRDLLKCVTTNYENKSFIDTNQTAEFLVFKNFSTNPYLNIINRCESKNILYMINRNNIGNILDL